MTNKNKKAKLKNKKNQITQNEMKIENETAKLKNKQNQITQNEMKIENYSSKLNVLSGREKKMK